MQSIIINPRTVIPANVYRNDAAGTTGTIGATGVVSKAFVQGSAGTDYKVDITVGGVTGCYGGTELATLQIHTAQNIGTIPAAPCQLVGHGVTGSNLVSLKGFDANSVATVYVRGPESAIAAPCFFAELTTGSTGISAISVVVSDVSRGSYNIPQ